MTLKKKNQTADLFENELQGCDAQTFFAVCEHLRWVCSQLPAAAAEQL